MASALQGEVPHIWFTSKGKSQWVSGMEEAQQTRPSHAAWTPRHSVTSSTGHQAWPAPKSLERGCVWNEAIFSAEDHILWARLCLIYKTASSCVQRGWFCDLQMTHFGSGMRLELHTHTHTPSVTTSSHRACLCFSWRLPWLGRDNCVLWNLEQLS